MALDQHTEILEPMLQFQDPYWLFAMLPVAGVLLWIHRHKTKELPLLHFGAMRFITSIQTKSNVAQALSNRLLLLLRLLMMCLLIIAFASPVWQVVKHRSATGCSLLLVDATASMCRTIGEKNAWQLAR